MFKLKYKDYNFQIDDNLNTLIVSDDETSLLDLIKEIAGINKSNVCLDDVNVFDNENYFKNRVFIDNNLEYINSLNTNKIINILLNNYYKVFIEEDFNRLVKDTHLRFYYDYKNRNKFTELGDKIVNNILALSIMNYRIIHKAFDGINDLKILDILKKEYLNKKGNLFSSSISQITKYINDNSCIDKIIILNNKAFVFDISSNVLLLNGKLSAEFDDEIIYKHNEHYYYRCELLKNVNFMNAIKHKKYKLVSLYQLGDDHD